jgi:hypothetical protein
MVNYFKEYILALRNKLQIDYNDALKQHNSITKYVEQYIITNPRNASIILGGGKDIINQYGGNKLENKEVIQKLTNIAGIFNKYKQSSNDMVQIENSSRQIDEYLKKILEEIEKMDTSQIESHNTKYQKKIFTDMEMFVNTLSKISNDDTINVESKKIDISLPVQELINTEQLNKSNYSLKIISELNSKIDNLSKNLYNEDYQKNIEDLNIEINIKSEDISNKINVLNTNIELLKNSQSITNDIEYKYNINGKVEKIMSFDTLREKIKNLKQNTNFKQRMIAEFKNLDTDINKKGSIKQRDIIDVYNKNILSLTTDEREDLPEFYFDGIYTKRIKNNMLQNEINLQDKVEMLQNILNDSKPVSFDNMFMPSFPLQLGGTDAITIRELYINVTLIAEKIQKLYELLNMYQQMMVKFNKMQHHYVMHTTYLSLIATNQFFVSNYVIYVYIGRGILTFYDRIINDIMRKIDNIDNPVIGYMKKYHYITLLKLKSFMSELINNLEVSDVIDINKCTGDVSKNFLLLNYFKTILENYNENMQNKITIYARINDMYNPILPNKIEIFDKHKMFISDWEKNRRENNITNKEDYTKLIVNYNVCKEFSDKPKEIELLQKEYNFTEVFDSSQYKNNGDISKYMTLDTQLSKGKGIAIMTYGYSGTGKTYTLFGTAEKEGILQSTLNNINGLKSIKFRLFELYGMGFTYPHYWTNQSGKSKLNDIKHEIYSYNLIADTEKLWFEKVNLYESDKIETFIKSDTYIFLQNDQASNLFKKFDQFMDLVDTERESKNRIRNTPNNVVSSRSMLMFDFLLTIDGIEGEVPFIIIDLPGREEIIETYVNPYITNTYIKNIILSEGESINEVNLSKKAISKNKLIEIEMLLTTLNLNPLGISIFAPVEVFNFINEMEIEDKNQILGIKGSVNYILNEAVGAKETGSHLYNFFSTKDLPNDNYEFIPPEKGTVGFGYVKSAISRIQYNSLIGIHFVNRLIEKQKFDLLGQLIKKIIHQYINKHIIKYIKEKITTYKKAQNLIEDLMSTNFKGEFIKKKFDALTLNPIDPDNKIDSAKLSINTIQTAIINMIIYDYYLTPYEGIYINENIAGLIKYLSENMIKNITEGERLEIRENLRREIGQNNSLTFDYQRKKARIWNMSHISDSQTIENFLDIDTNMYRVPKILRKELPKIEIQQWISNTPTNILSYDYDNMMEERTDMIISYKSNGLFNFDNPLITNVLDPYIKKISDYKVFYLFGNYSGEMEKYKNLKCKHQSFLLSNTKDFIEKIVGKE